MALPDRFRSRGFWWTAAAAFAVVLLAAIPAVRPGWFVESSGQITLVSGVGMAVLLALGLLLGWQWVRYLVLAFLVLGAVASAAWALLYADPAFLAGYLLLVALAAFAAGMLAFAPPVRAYFRRGASSDGRQRRTSGLSSAPLNR